jgi:hypothetical protein
MACIESARMAEQRALLTETERQILAGEREVKDNYRYSVESRVRSRLRDRLAADVDVLREQQPEMFSLIEEVVCEGESDGGTGAPEPSPPERNPVGDASFPADDEGGDVRLPDKIDQEVADVVDRVSASWDDDARLENRRRAAMAVLQFALDTGEDVGKSHQIVDAAIEAYPVEEQNRETYYLKNLRSVLSEVGNYSAAARGYTVDGLPGEGDEE